MSAFTLKQKSKLRFDTEISSAVVSHDKTALLVNSNGIMHFLQKTPDGQFVKTADSGSLPRSSLLHEMYGFNIFPGNKKILCQQDGYLKLVDSNFEKVHEWRRLSSKRCNAADVSADGKWIASSWGNAISIWNVKKDEKEALWSDKDFLKQHITWVKFTPCGQYLITLSDKDIVTIWNIKDLTNIKREFRWTRAGNRVCHLNVSKERILVADEENFFTLLDWKRSLDGSNVAHAASTSFSGKFCNASQSDTGKFLIASKESLCIGKSMRYHDCDIDYIDFHKITDRKLKRAFFGNDDDTLICVTAFGIYQYKIVRVPRPSTPINDDMEDD